MARAMIEAVWSSAGGLSIAPLQDLLNLGDEARMNVPGHPDGNWRWRCTEDMLHDGPFEWLRDLTCEAKRAKPSRAPETEVMAGASKGPEGSPVGT